MTGVVHLRTQEGSTLEDEAWRREGLLAILKMGAWYSRCCIQDLYPIEIQEQLDDLREELEDWDEGDGWWVHVWATREEALADPWING